MLNAPPRELLAAIVDSSDDGIVSKTLDGVITSWNRAAERMFGYTAEEAVGRPIVMLFPVERLSEEEHFLREIGAGRRVEHFETERVRKDGRRILVAVTVSPIRDADGRIIGVSTILRDLSDRTRLERRAAKAAADLDRILSSVGEGFAALDPDLRYVYVNDAAVQLVGIPREAVIGRTPWDLFPPEVLESVLPRIRNAMERSEVIRYEVFHPVTGRWYENRLYPSPDGVSIFFTDVSARKKAEAALRESRDVLALAMRGGRMGAWSRNLLTEAVWWSRELEEIFGLPPGAFSGTTDGFRSFVHPEDRAALETAVETALSSRGDYIVEFRFRHADGSWRWMEGRGRADYADDGTPIALHGLGIDITERKVFEEALAAARDAADADAERLNLAMAAARLGDWSWDIATDVVTFSPRAAEIFLLPPGASTTWAEMRGLLHPEDRERARIAAEEAMASGRDYSLEYRLINGGRERWVSAGGRGRYDENGAPLGMFGVVQDITRDRLLVRLDDAVRTLTNPSEITYTAARSLGQHLGADRCAYAVVEEDEDTFVLTGNYINGVHSIVGRYRFRQFGTECLRLMRAGEPFVVEDSHVDPRIDSEDREAYEATSIRAVICVPILKSGRFVAAMAVHSRTPRAWHPDETSLVQQVASRCWESIERARIESERAALLEAAEAANRAKDEFMAMLGHELRNPLSPILTALHLMKLKDGSGAQRERIVIERQVAHLTRLVDDLLDVSRIARGKVELKVQVLELADAVRSAIEIASPILEERKQMLVLDVPRTGLLVDADPARLSQVVSNLLTNAAKYTPAGGRITVAASREGDSVLLRVRDTGIGITPEALPRIFDMFVQGRQAIDRAQGGLGLGLTIVKNLVERHGGQVEARSEGPDRGSEFVVRLPAAAQAVAPAAGTTGRRPAAAAPRHARVLVVDDNKDAAAMVAEALALKGYQTRVAHDGLEALREAAEFKPDAAFLDLGLPVMDGFELAARLRELPGLEDVRLVAVTGYGQESDRRRTAAAGFHHHVVKPVDPEALESLIAS